MSAPIVDEHRHIRENPGQGLSRAMGWFSIGLGAAQITAPHQVNRLVGVDDDDKNRALQRLIGFREIVSGIGILSHPRPAAWLWARVGGDVMDAALLATALGSPDADKDRVKGSLAAVFGVMAADMRGAMELTAAGGTPLGTRPADNTIPVERIVTVWRQPDEVYRFWHNFENLPRFMNHLESVQTIGEGRTHWVAKGPAGRKVEWDAEIVEDRPNELIAWRSLEGADVSNAGTVRFSLTPDKKGTEVRVHLHYAPPGGVAGMTIARLFGEEPNLQLKEDLHRFKQVMEVGEVILSDATVTKGARLRQDPAQPPPPEKLPEQLPADMPYGEMMGQSGTAATA